MADEHDVARLAGKQVSHPVGRIVRPQPADHLELGEGIARAQHRLGGLAGPQLAAMPDDRRRAAGALQLSRQRVGLPAAEHRQRPLRIDVGTYRVGVMNKEDVHGWYRSAIVYARSVPSQDRAVPTRAVAAWVVYDLANTIFSMGIISLFFPHFIERAVGETRVDRVFGLIQAVSYGIIFVLSPLLGAMTDRAGRRMPFLIWSTVICVAATGFLGQGSFMFSAVLFIIANAAYQAGLQFYDALLPDVTTEQNRGRVSGIGVGIGYLGSFVAVAMGFAFAEASYTQPSQFGPLFLAIAATFAVLFDSLLSVRS